MFLRKLRLAARYRYISIMLLKDKFITKNITLPYKIDKGISWK